MVLPSGCSTCSWASSAVRSPHWSDGAQHADLAAVPPVGQHRAQHVRALGDQPGDVVGLHLRAVRVLRVAGRELEVTHAFAVQVRLVDPVCGDVQPRDRDRLRDWTSPRSRYAGRDPAGPAECSTGRTHSADQSDASSSPASRSVGSDQSPSPRSVHTRTLTSRRSPEARGSARPRHQHVVGRLDATGADAVDRDLVGDLLGRARRELPRQPRAAYADAERLLEVFDTHAHAEAFRSGVATQPATGTARNSATPMPLIGAADGRRSGRRGVHEIVGHGVLGAESLLLLGPVAPAALDAPILAAGSPFLRAVHRRCHVTEHGHTCLKRDSSIPSSSARLPPTTARIIPLTYVVATRREAGILAGNSSVTSGIR